MASSTRVLYVGVTNNLNRRVQEHKQGVISGFTKRYRVKRLVYFEEYRLVQDAIRREKEIKKWRREKKLALIDAMNPGWTDFGKDL